METSPAVCFVVLVDSSSLLEADRCLTSLSCVLLDVTIRSTSSSIEGYVISFCYVHFVYVEELNTFENSTSGLRIIP